MAKMFYTLDEAAEKLGLSEDAVKAMAAEGKLQQFRDRDKLMFKRDQVDGLAGSAGSGGAGSSGAVPLASSATGSSMILLDDSGDTKIEDALDATDANEASGVSVFDAGEIEPADPMAQTQVTSPSSGAVDDEELALETVGSGSGLLDLTRESDDTSLGAELLDEIYPGDTGSGSNADFKMESSVGSSGVFDGAMSMDTGSAGMSAGLDHLSGSVAADSAVYPAEDMGAAPVSSGPATYAADDYDPVGSGLSAGLLFGALAALAVGLMVTASAVMGFTSKLTTMFTGDQGFGMMALTGGLVGVTVICAGIGIAFAKMGNK